MVGPAAKREAVAYLRTGHGLSEPRACRIVGADRKMVRYQSQHAPDTELRRRLRELANERRMFGYWRLFVLLRRDGEPSGINRIYRLYREEGLTVRKRTARRKAIGTRTPILVEARPNARWSLDFVHDHFANGQRFRVLNVVDDVTQEGLAAIPDTSISGRCGTRELTALIERRKKHGMIASDNGTELTSNAILRWCSEHQIEWHYVAPRASCLPAAASAWYSHPPAPSAARPPIPPSRHIWSSACKRPPGSARAGGTPPLSASRSALQLIQWINCLTLELLLFDYPPSRQIAS
ncbi:transposase [Leisingera methylohalidivorans DSM 14336]|uniref:Transposase n=1 Tax=Leisingera methylohalidivorans DSM 14336 TaxID=999552 RepID=V9VWN9_9RHOB|nr:transposase [Leisingera methylohalidivorans DSM 14336]